jgi:hypothetical protein
VEQERVMKIGTDHPEGAAALLQNDQGINYLDAEDFVSWFSNRKKTSSLVKQKTNFEYINSIVFFTFSYFVFWGMAQTK